MALPLALDLRGRAVVAVGGGPVSARRVTAFVAEGAQVTVIAPWLCEDLVDLVAEDAIRWIARDYAGSADLAGARLVHTATGDPSTDDAVAADSELLGLWCVHAAAAERTPAAVLARTSVDLPDGAVTVAVHASADPRRAVAVRDAIATSLTTGSLPLRPH